MINPNGPLLNGGSDGDNGQTGRKLVMDYYGPRVPIGGGAIYGKDYAHIDRRAGRMAREMALERVKAGEKEALVTVAFAPGVGEALEVAKSTIKGQPTSKETNRGLSAIFGCRNHASSQIATCCALGKSRVASSFCANPEIPNSLLRKFQVILTTLMRLILV